MSVTKVAKFTARGARRKILRKSSPHMRFPAKNGHRNHELEGPFRARAPHKRERPRRKGANLQKILAFLTHLDTILMRKPTVHGTVQASLSMASPHNFKGV